MRRRRELPSWMDLGELVDLLNAGEIAAHRPPSWNRWNARAACERAGVRLFQGGARCKLWVNTADLKALLEGERGPQEPDDDS